ncbi:MAG TPA: hypothetical protein VFS10_15990 [Pyrinomonadaceae bacterium]|nr:hypothetical protein [Pyrinomonadaceae bacterium]
MRRTIQSLVLMLALSAHIYAGEMQFPLTSPTPPPAPAVQEPMTDGVIPNDASDGHIQNDAMITFAEVVLNLLALS